MLSDLVGHVVSAIVGEAILDSLFPGRSKPQPPPPEGEWNASLGSVAAFLSAIAAMFCGPAVLGLLQGITDTFLWIVLGGALIVAMVAGVLARRALEVTRRRRALARIGLWLARATVLTGLLAAVLAIAGVNVPAP